MSPDSSISKIIKISQSFKQSQKLRNVIRNLLTDSEIEKLLETLDKIHSNYEETEQMNADTGEKINKIESIKLDIFAALKELKTNEYIKPANTIENFRKIWQDIKKEKLPEEEFRNMDINLKKLENTGYQYPLITARLKCYMIIKFRNEYPTENVYDFFKISRRTLNYNNTFHNLLTKYPSLIRSRLTWSTIVKNKNFIEFIIREDPELEYVCEQDCNPVELNGKNDGRMELDTSNEDET